MTLEFREMLPGSGKLDSHRVFLSASIPDPERWPGSFDAFGITDAVVACCRAVITEGGTLVTAAHPTIAPLLLYVAREFPKIREEEPSVIVYQSRLFDDFLPPATDALAQRGFGQLIWTEAAPHEEPVHGYSEVSLSILRLTMLEQTQPDAAIFVGGMEGINDEFSLYRRLFSSRPTYPLGRPGGAAASLVDEGGPPNLVSALASDDVYPSLFRRIVDDIARGSNEEGS